MMVVEVDFQVEEDEDIVLVEDDFQVGDAVLLVEDLEDFLINHLIQDEVQDEDSEEKRVFEIDEVRDIAEEDNLL